MRPLHPILLQQRALWSSPPEPCELQPRSLIAERPADGTGESQTEGCNQPALAAAKLGQSQPSLNCPGAMQAIMISAVALIEVTLDVRRPLRIQAPGQHEFQTMITRHRGD